MTSPSTDMTNEGAEETRDRRCPDNASAVAGESDPQQGAPERDQRLVRIQLPAAFLENTKRQHDPTNPKENTVGSDADTPPTMKHRDWAENDRPMVLVPLPISPQLASLTEQLLAPPDSPQDSPEYLSWYVKTSCSIKSEDDLDRAISRHALMAAARLVDDNPMDRWL